MSFAVEIISPKFNTTLNAKIVILPGELGQFGVLKHHANIITKLVDGIILIDNYTRYRISSGFAHMKNEKLIIASENIEVV